MKLKEYIGKELFRKYGINVPNGVLVRSLSDLGNVETIKAEELVVKAQVLVGGRGKAGGIRTAKRPELRMVVSGMLGSMLKGEKISEVLVEEKLRIDRELYLSFVVNRAEKNFSLVFSESGGVDIEETAEKHPDKIVRVGLLDFDESIIKNIPNITGIGDLISRLYKLFRENDCQLAEINPLVVSKNILIAADAKIIIDDNALYRHPEFNVKTEELTELEDMAKKSGLQYVELDGNIAVIGNGAGLVMATLDMINHFGGKPANFLDVGGGASVEQMELAIRIALMKKPKALFINIFGGITRCDEIAQGISNYKSRNRIEIPMVVRMIGTNEEMGRKILEENKIHSIDTMEEGARKVVELAK